MTTRFCLACGKDLKLDDAFCTKCGAKRDTKESTRSSYGTIGLIAAIIGYRLASAILEAWRARGFP